MLATKRHYNRKLLWLSRLLSTASIAVLIIGGAIGWNQYQANKAADDSPEPAAHRSITANTPAPSTKKPEKSEFDTYETAADLPRYIFIPKLSVQAMVKHLGLTKTNQIDTPANVHDTGWYNQSAKPGQSGAMLIDGHVSSWKTHGVFYDLKVLKAGDDITVQRGDGVVFAYKVVKLETYDADKVDMPTVLAPVNSSKPGLNLVTCTGSVIKGTNEFDKRIVVFAEQTN